MKINNEPILDNKASLDNYQFYNSIRKRIKFNNGILVLFELFLMYAMLMSLMSTNQIKGIIIIFTGVLLLAKNLLCLFSNIQKKFHISLFVDSFAILMFIICNAEGYSTSRSIISDIPFELILPAIYVYFVYSRNRTVEKALSELPDYPYFKTELYQLTDKPEPIPFDEDNKTDQLLKKYLFNAYTHGRSQISEYIRCGCVILAFICLFFLAGSVSEAAKAGKAVQYEPGKIYDESEYLILNVDTSDPVNTAFISDKNMWIKLADSEKYISVVGSHSYLNDLKAQKSSLLTVKTIKPDDLSFHYEVLCLPVLKTSVSELNEDSRNYLQSITIDNICVKIVNKDLTEDMILYLTLGILLLAAVYLLSNVLLSKISR